MRLFLAAAAASAMITTGLAAAPASAGTLGSVGAVTVDRSTANDGSAYVNVSWASEPSNADGALVCLHRGINVISRPDNCESQIAVDSPRLSSGLIAIHPAKNYVVEVFSYRTTSPITYGPPVSKLRHGIKVTITPSCGSQTVGSTCRITATVTDVFSGASLANRQVQLWTSSEKQPGPWTLVTTRTTGNNGQARATVTLSRTRVYQWHYSAPRTRELSSSSSRIDIVVG